MTRAIAPGCTFEGVARVASYGSRHREKRSVIARNASIVLYVAALVVVVVAVDVVFFRNRFWERLIVNIGIVLVFAAFYLRFFKSP